MKALMKPVCLVTWLVLLSFGMDTFAADFVARLDRNRVVEGDPIVLTLAASGGFNGAPDLTPLQQDFDLLNRSQSTHMRFINGRGSSGTEWRLTLMPKGTGKIEIPAIRLGPATSRPLTLEVLPASQAADQGIPRPVMVEVDAEPKNPYVQQKVIYTVRLLMAGPLRDVKLSEPSVNDALIHPLGQERRYETYRHGRQFQAVERQYAVQPQLSGTLKIGGPLLTGRISDPTSGGNSRRSRVFGNDPFSSLGRMFDQGRPITARGPELALEVRPQPAGTASPWLPAETLTLNDSWSPQPPVFRVGEPVTRTITISATGLAGEQLPDLAFDLPSGMKAYPEQSRAETRPGNGTLLARKTIKAALIPSQSGDSTLPEVRVTWWDVATGKEVVAALPSQRIDVLPAAPGSMTTTPSPAPVSNAVPFGDIGRFAAPQAEDKVPAVQGNGGYWPWIAGLLAIAVIVISALWLRERRSRPVPEAPARNPVSTGIGEIRPDSTRALVAVERAFRADDARGARKALLAWAKTRWPADPPISLDAMGQRLGGTADRILRDLDSALYGNSATATSWDGRGQWPAIKELLTEPKNKAKKELINSNLPPLYPNTH